LLLEHRLPQRLDDGRPHSGHGNRLKLALLGIDTAACVIAWSFTLVTQPARWSPATSVWMLSWVTAGVVLTLAVVASHSLYLARACSVRAVEVRGLGRSALGSGLLATLIDRFLHTGMPLRTVWTASLCCFILLVVGRSLFRGWLRRERAAGRFVRDLVLIGDDADAGELAAVIREHPAVGFRVCGYVGDPAAADRIHAPHLGPIRDAVAVVERSSATGALIAASALDAEQLNQLVRQLLEHGIRVQLSSGVRGIAHHRFRPTPIAYEPLFYIEPTSLQPWQLGIKRAVDIVGAAVGLVVALPVMAAAAIALRVESEGPLFFRQSRVGRNGRPFTMYKLRTMTVDAEQRQDVLQARNERNGGPLFKLADDPRITRIGRFLRATSIDELPQLFNVLTGSMSLVGPRPALPTEVGSFDERLQLRTRVAPGLTGLWQVEARDNPAFGPYRRLDLFYVENWSPLLDLSILLTTVMRVTARAIRYLGPASPAADSMTPVVLE
jgi:exopolysaccharide biosynthesis polyprenyl glycosylphosphotransferase